MGAGNRHSWLAIVSLLLASFGCGGTADDAGPEPVRGASANSAARGSDEYEPPALPVFMLEVSGKPIGPRDGTDGVLTIIETHDGSLNDLPGRPGSVRSAVTLEIHGDISQNLDKKSYQLELVDDRREERELSLLGLPPGSDWVLHSCGFDPVCLRNALAYTLARQFGQYAPRTRFIELFLDGGYQGLYVLTERVRRDRERVNVPRPASSGAEGDITGGYIFRMDLAEGSPNDRIPRDWVSPITPTVYSYHYPRFDDITSDQKAYLREHMTRFEAMMRSGHWNDPRTGYRQWLDVPSWVDFALIQELSMNPDAYFKSIYLQKWPRSMGDKIAIGPIWDFDLAFGVADFRDARNTQAWAHTMNRFGNEPVPYNPPGKVPYVPEYWERLWTDPAFHLDVRCRWQELRKSALHLDSLNAMIDGWLAQLKVALARDRARWITLPKSPYEPGIGVLKEFLTTRIAWLDANLPGTCSR